MFPPPITRQLGKENTPKHLPISAQVGIKKPGFNGPGFMLLKRWLNVANCWRTLSQNTFLKKPANNGNQYSCGKNHPHKYSRLCPR